MAVPVSEPLEQLENRILTRLDSHDRSQVMSLLHNVIIFIKRINGYELSRDEQNYPGHPLFSHAEQEGGQNTAEMLLYRIRLIDCYHLDKTEFIIEVLTKNIPTGKKSLLSARKAQILWQLNKDPTIPKYRLAKRVGITPRTLTRDLTELERDYLLRVHTTIDPHKFHLTEKIIVFETKSLEHMKKLENFFNNHQGFLRYCWLDQDLRRGVIVYRYPNQPEGHRSFVERVRWFLDELFIDANVIEASGLHQFISFEMYNPATYSFSIEPEIVSQVPFDYSKHHLDTLPQPRGMTFTHPFWFDQADFLLSDTLYSSRPFASPEYKQRLLRRHGFDYSIKTIWKKQKRLRTEKAGFPTIELQIPGFDEDLTLVVFCSHKAASSIRAISAFLPYVMIVDTDSGCLLRIQRPIHTSTLTAQLVRKIHDQKGVSDVKLLRFQQRFQTPLLPDIVDRWNPVDQKWQIIEGDI